MPLYAYGEDGHTLAALTGGLGAVLRKLKDDTPLQDTTRFYRPSFGRGGRRPPGGPATFGEFDAIVGTHRRVYLIESKPLSGPWPGGVRFSVSEKQRRRHAIFRWYLESWRTHPPVSWSAFCKEHDDDFRAKFPRRTLPKPGSSLSRQLTFVLTALADQGAEIRDVLLVIVRPGTTILKPPDFDGFTIVAHRTTHLLPSGHFTLTDVLI